MEGFCRDSHIILYMYVLAQCVQLVQLLQQHAHDNDFFLLPALQLSSFCNKLQCKLHCSQLATQLLVLRMYLYAEVIILTILCLFFLNQPTLDISLLLDTTVPLKLQVASQLLTVLLENIFNQASFTLAAILNTSNNYSQYIAIWKY